MKLETSYSMVQIAGIQTEAAQIKAFDYSK